MFGLNREVKISTDEEKIQHLLTRNVDEVFVKESLYKKLKSGKQLRVKLGFDPTGSSVHIGRAITLRKLKEFQDLGHKVVFLVGNFTAQIGDPSDKLSKRPMLNKEEVERNLKNYIKIVGKIIDISKIEVVYNADWLSKLTFEEIANLADSFTVAQMTNRRNFKTRLDSGEDVSLREFLYPLMQGYDSVAVDADVELGGTDQLFNLKAGRIVQKFYNKPQQDIMTTIMLDGTDGRKMSTSWGNVINIDDEANDMYGKVMSLNDDLIVKYFYSCTDVALEEVSDIEKQLKEEKVNPKDIKMRLAREIVGIYHNEKKALEAEEEFVKTFSEKLTPDEIKEIVAKKGEKLSVVLTEEKILESIGEFKRLIKGGAIKDVEKEIKIEDVDYTLGESVTLKIGKRRFLKITIQS